MPDESSIPTPPVNDVPTFKILIEGTEMNSSYEVLNISVTKELNKISGAEIILLDGNVSIEDFEVSNTEDFIPGKQIQIQAGYQGDDSTIFKGVVVKHGIKIVNNESVLSVTLKNDAYKSALERKNKVFSEAKDSDIIQDILSNYSFDIEVEDSMYQHESLVQFNCSDWDFINMRAEVVGKLVYTSDEKLIIKKPDFAADPKLLLSYGSTIKELEAEMDGRSSFSNYKAITWDYVNQEIKNVEQSCDIGEVSQGNLPVSDIASNLEQENYNINVNGPRSEDEITEYTNSQILKNNLSRIKGRVKSNGVSDINPGDIIQLEGVGDRFNGKAIVSGVNHSIKDGLWETNIQFGLDNKKYAEKFDNIIEKEASGLIPAIHGLQIGKVMQLEGDPLSEHRILIKLPMITDSDNTFWARVSALDAGNNRGTFFRPEIDDEVIVGFIDDNPNCAVVLGMMNSSTFPAPVEAADANNIKGIYTRSAMKMEFDDSQSSILIQTPGGNKIFITDNDQKILIEDQSGNKITLNTDGIKMEDKNYNTVTLDSNGLELKDVSGNKVTLSTSGVSIFGASSIKLESSQITLSAGQLNLQSGMVSATGIIQANTVIATSVVSSSYTPGAGNIW
jgi:Rhs element Vgr protein